MKRLIDRLRPHEDELENNNPLAAFIDSRYFWIHYPQKKGSQKVETLIQKGSIRDLKEKVPVGTPIYDMNKVDVRVMIKNRPVEVDRSEGKCRYPEFIQAIEKAGAIQLW